MKITAYLGIAAGMVAITVGAANADTVAFSPTGIYNSTDFGSAGNDGLFFTVGASPILVSALGYFHDGAVHSNPAGIFRVSDGMLMGSTVVTTTAGTPTIPMFDYSSTSIALSANTSYAVVGWYNHIAGQFNSYAANMGAAAGISYDGYKYNTNGSLSMPDIAYEPSYIGPNFQFSIVPLPPAAFAGATTLAGVAAMGVVRRRRNSIA